MVRTVRIEGPFLYTFYLQWKITHLGSREIVLVYVMYPKYKNVVPLFLVKPSQENGPKPNVS